MSPHTNGAQAVETERGSSLVVTILFLVLLLIAIPCLMLVVGGE